MKKILNPFLVMENYILLLLQVCTNPQVATLLAMTQFFKVMFEVSAHLCMCVEVCKTQWKCFDARFSSTTDWLAFSQCLRVTGSINTLNCNGCIVQLWQRIQQKLKRELIKPYHIHFAILIQICENSVITIEKGHNYIKARCAVLG